MAPSGGRLPPMRHAKLLIAALALAAAACGRSSPASTDELRRDLELARGQGLELVPRGAGQSTVSAAELIPQGTKASSSREVRAPRRATVSAPKPQTPQAPAVADVPVTPEPVRPQPAGTRPAMNPEPKGGYKSMGDLIRKAPFPINPVHPISQF
jgi:hypothetical protein